MTGDPRPRFLFLLSEKGHEFNQGEILEFLKADGSIYPAALDWCCVHNFHAESRPRILSLPPGFGPIFRSDMEHFIRQARRKLRTIFASEDYRLEAENLRMRFDQQEMDVVQPIYEDLSSACCNEGDEEDGTGGQETGGEFRETLSVTPAIEAVHGIASAQPVKADEQLARDKIRLLKKRCSEELDSFTESKARETIAPFMLALKKKYRRNSKVLVYLEEVGEDILKNLHAFTLPVSNDSVSGSRKTSREGSGEHLYSPYAVNVLVTRGSIQDPPLVFARNADQGDLFGTISSEADLLSSQAGFTFIKPGTLHEANGGFLLIEASWILQHFHLWEQLKAVIIRGELGQIGTDPRCHVFASGNLLPETIPLHTTVIVIGSSSSYSVLSIVDPDFPLLTGKPTVKCNPGREEIPGEVPSSSAEELPSGKHIDISARRTILSMFRDPGTSRDSIEERLIKILAVIRKAHDHTGPGQVSAEHISKAAREMYPEISHEANAVLLQRQKAKPSGPDKERLGPKAPIESIKLNSRKVITYGKQT